MQWWAGWTGAQTKAALAALPVTEVDLGGTAGVALADDLDFPAEAPAVAALLPALDPTPMGWQSRSWYLDPHTPRLFDRTGNVGPTVWWAGRVVGGWAQRASGEVVYRLLEDIGADAAAAVAAEATALEVVARVGAGHAPLPHAAGARTLRVSRLASGPARRNDAGTFGPGHPSSSRCSLEILAYGRLTLGQTEIAPEKQVVVPHMPAPR